MIETLAILAMLASQAQVTPGAKGPTKQGLVFVASTPDNTYKKGSRIPFTYYLQNLGTDPVFVYAPTEINMFFYDRRGGVGVDIVDAETSEVVKGVETLRHRGAAFVSFPVSEAIKNYDLLLPRCLVGRTDEFDSSDLTPGSYVLFLRYFDDEPEEWDEVEKAKLRYDVFSGRILSNPVPIIITEK